MHRLPVIDEWGRKEILGLTDGYRESTQSWRELLLDLKRRGLDRAPDLAVGDGALGFWAALREVFGETAEQRCWFHSEGERATGQSDRPNGNVLNAMPKPVQAKAKGHLHDIWQAETKAEANAAFDFFVETYGLKYDKAVAKLIKDQDALLAFYDFPAERAQALASRSEPPTLSRAVSPPSVTAPEKPKAASAAKLVWLWPSN